MTWQDEDRQLRKEESDFAGARYEGELHELLPHGQGDMAWPDGRRYEGEWRNGKPHRGILVLTALLRGFFQFELRDSKFGKSMAQ